MSGESVVTGLTRRRRVMKCKIEAVVLDMKSTEALPHGKLSEKVLLLY